jgi:hypothetical protein
MGRAKLSPLVGGGFGRLFQKESVEKHHFVKEEGSGCSVA